LCDHEQLMDYDGISYAVVVPWETAGKPLQAPLFSLFLSLYSSLYHLSSLLSVVLVSDTSVIQIQIFP